MTRTRALQGIWGHRGEGHRGSRAQHEVDTCMREMDAAGGREGAAMERGRGAGGEGRGYNRAISASEHVDCTSPPVATGLHPRPPIPRGSPPQHTQPCPPVPPCHHRKDTREGRRKAGAPTGSPAGGVSDPRPPQETRGTAIRESPLRFQIRRAKRGTRARPASPSQPQPQGAHPPTPTQTSNTHAASSCAPPPLSHHQASCARRPKAPNASQNVFP